MRWTDALVRVPRWSEHPSGLLVPTNIRRPLANPDPVDLPPGIQVNDAALLIMAKPPSSFDQIRTFVDEAGLGYSTSTFPDLTDAVGHLSFEVGMIALSQLSAHIVHMRGELNAQLELAQTVFGDDELVERIARVAKTVGGALEVFPEQHITALQRLLVLYGKSTPLGQEDPNEQRIFNRVFPAVSCLTAEDTLATSPDTKEARAGWLAYLIQNGTYNRTDSALESMTRSQVLLGDLPKSPDLAQHPDRLDIDGLFENAGGFTVADQFVLGFSVMAATKPFDESLGLHDRSLLAQSFLPEIAERMALEPDRVGAALSADRDWYGERFLSEPDSPVRAAWDRIPFDQRPLLRLTDGRHLLVSPRAIQNWMGDGIFHRALAAARARGDDDKFLRFYGALVERYVLQVFDSVAGDASVEGSGRVFAEIPFRRGRDRLKSPDVVIDCGEDLILVEVTSGRFTLATLLKASPDAALRDLNRLVFRKVEQLAERTHDFFNGDWTPPGVDIPRVRRVWPVVVTADILLNELLWDELAESLPAGLRDARVQPLTLLDLADVEQLAAIIDTGQWLPTLLHRKTSGVYARLDFRRFVFDAPDLPANRHLTMLEERWHQAVLDAVARLGFDIDESRLPRSE